MFILLYITHSSIDKSIGELDRVAITSLSRFDTDVNEMQIKSRLCFAPRLRLLFSSGNEWGVNNLEGFFD